MIWPVVPSNTNDSSGSSAMLDLVSWSPKGNAFVFVYQKNVYYQSSVRSQPVVVSSSSSDEIINGVPDWLYEEEILYSEQAIWWSPTGSSFVYASFNDSQVPAFSFDMYGNDDNNHLYPSLVSIKYPKVGQPNPEVRLFVVRVHDDQPRSRVDTPILLTAPPEVPTEHYVTSVSWVDEHRLLIAFVNRVQNVTMVVLCSQSSGTSGVRSSATSWKCALHVQLRPTRVNSGWIDFIEPIIDASRQVVFVRHSSVQESRGAFKHIAKIDLTVSLSSSSMQAYTHKTNVLFFLINLKES
jgi:dipeptidyl aminopeptidase/acylaminoacyl peptidase